MVANSGHLELPYSFLTQIFINFNTYSLSGGYIPNWNPSLSIDLIDSDFIISNGNPVAEFNEIFMKNYVPNPSANIKLISFKKTYARIENFDTVGWWCVWRFGFYDNNSVYHTGNITFKIVQ